jgi:hypothetical protein
MLPFLLRAKGPQRLPYLIGASGGGPRPFIPFWAFNPIAIKAILGLAQFYSKKLDVKTYAIQGQCVSSDLNLIKKFKCP